MGVGADWRVKRMGGDGSFKAVSSVADLSASAMLLAQTPVADDEQPPNKLDNFLGCNPLSSSSDHDHLHLNHNHNKGGSGTASSSSMLGLSMIKSWLRTHPPNSNTSTSLAGTEIGAPAQALSLSTASASGGGSAIDRNDPQMQTAPPLPPPLDNSSTDDTPTTLSVDSLSRRSVDTFGQRTSIYRGVTRFPLLPFSQTPHRLLIYTYAYKCPMWGCLTLGIFLLALVQA